MKSIILIAGAVISAVFLVCLYLLYLRPELSTGYANSMVKGNLAKVRSGDSIDEVYNQLGAPIYFAVISSNPTQSVAYDYDVSKAHVRDMMTNINVQIDLQFSTNNGFSGWYRRFEIDMRNEKVVRVLQDLQD
jgi:hypothetical protein